VARDIKPDVDVPAAAPLAGIYRAHYPYVWAVLRRLGVPDADLDDATQDVFVVAHDRLARFDGRAAMRTWLYAIAIRIAANRRRKLARRQALAVLIPPRVTDDPEEEVARLHGRTMIEALLAQLDDDKRAVFVLAELEELTVPVIARIVGANTRTVYSRLRAARARVARELERLHERAGIEPMIAAARVRTPPPDGSERRVWAGVLARITIDAASTPAIASVGLGALGKMAIAGSAIAAALAVVIVLPSASPPVVEHEPMPTARTRPQPSATPAAVAPVLTAHAPVAASPSSTPATAAVQPASRAAPPTKTVEPTDALAEELALVDAARNALAGDRIAAALAVLDEHDARFPSGELRHEADATRVRALCRIDPARAASLAGARGLPADCAALRRP